MIGRTPGHIQAIRPLKDGVIADFEICEKMLRYFIHEGAPAPLGEAPHGHLRARRASPASSSGPCRRPPSTPAPASPPTSSRSRWPRPSAPGLPVQEPTGNMIVDIGGGTTEVAVISLGGIVASQSVRVGGDELDEAIIQFIKKEYSLALGERTAEEVKIALGSAWPLEEELHAEIRGRDLVTGLPKTIVTSTEEIREAIEEPVAPSSTPSRSRSTRRRRSWRPTSWRRASCWPAAAPCCTASTPGSQHETGMPIVHRARTRSTPWPSARASRSRSSRP